MTLDDWKSALARLKEFVHPLVVQFIGGEPFVWPKFLELIEFCRANDINWGVITNGSAFSAKITKRVAVARPINIDVSVDGATSNIHDRARGIEGSLEKITSGVLRLLGERDKAGQKFPVRIKCTVH
jgi:MoaA/NifB/PqqE/SkfB family radical SAM enzyme